MGLAKCVFLPKILQKGCYQYLMNFDSSQEKRCHEKILTGQPFSKMQFTFHGFGCRVANTVNRSGLERKYNFCWEALK